MKNWTKCIRKFTILFSLKTDYLICLYTEKKAILKMLLVKKKKKF